MLNSALHQFHIPVLGLGFSIDTPIKVAHFGIDSVISIVDDDLIEKMRKVYCIKYNLTYYPISIKEKDYRAKRITAYLNLVDYIVRNNFELLKKSYGKENSEFEKYIDMLPENSAIKLKYNTAKQNDNLTVIRDWILSNLKVGSIDVNIMTKLDKANYSKGEKLSIEYNDAHAALRGFANSNLNSSVILSAGMNARLYSYFEKFSDFYPEENGKLNKKIILKVSDYRSALIQGKFLAKKGLWVSEYRIESGLNCGGHAFATDGYLMGPILEEFKSNRKTLTNITHEIFVEALKKKNIVFNSEPLELKITAQGGVGTYEEQKFLLDHFQIDSIGWGSPFLLVPEATSVDKKTLNKLAKADEDDLYLSGTSPLGVPFNNLKGNSKDIEKIENANTGHPGSACPKKYLQLNTEISDKPICTASRTYQAKKIESLKLKNLDDVTFAKEYEKIIEKSCLCVGLATSTLQENGAADKTDGEGVVVCPGPNLAYFSSVLSLKEMTNHIYGRRNHLAKINRPNMFMKELKLYIDFLRSKMDEVQGEQSEKQKKYFEVFQSNLLDGIEYYRKLFSSAQNKIINISGNVLIELSELEKILYTLKGKLIANDIIRISDEQESLVAAVNE